MTANPTGSSAPFGTPDDNPLGLDDLFSAEISGTAPAAPSDADSVAAPHNPEFSAPQSAESFDTPASSD
ncbi:hypothetical protein, partial [Actinomyces sp. MRS3W]|uniref:hypothetical protein n=1 Tax=Actinomyces sp. MRS3W TaxID=2800796 RepID=UPI0028FDC0F1